MHTSRRPVRGARQRPVLVYDGDCSICSRLAGIVVRRMRPDVDVVASQVADLPGLGTTRERADDELLFVGLDGSIAGGAQAVASLLLVTGRWWAPLGRAIRVPPLRWLAHWVYRFVASIRRWLPGGTDSCSSPATKGTVRR